MNDTNNGLSHKFIHSNATELDIIDVKNDIISYVQKYFADKPGLAVFYLTDGIRFARWNGKTFDWADEEPADWRIKLRLARIFTEEKELKIWQDEQSLRYRLRDDSKGAEIGLVEANQLLWGTTFKSPKAGWISLTEERGTELLIPFDKMRDMEKHDRIAIRTRNYYQALDNHQMSYCDSRFVEFVLVSEPEKKGK